MISTRNNQPLTYAQVAEQIRKDLQSVKVLVSKGEKITASLRVWQSGEVVLLTLSGMALIERMEQLERDLVWEDTRSKCAIQPISLPVQRQLVTA